MGIQCVCFIGKLNQPLCIRTYAGTNELALHMSLYGALDVLESVVTMQEEQVKPTEGVSSPNKTPSAVTSIVADPYLGYLCPAVGTTSALGVAAIASSTLAHHYQEHTAKTESAGGLNTLASQASGERGLLTAESLVDLGVFGYVTSSRLKILAIVEETAAMYADPNLRPLFRHLHRLYADCIANPFFLDQLNSPRFVSLVDQSVAYHSQLLFKVE